MILDSPSIERQLECIIFQMESLKLHHIDAFERVHCDLSPGGLTSVRDRWDQNLSLQFCNM